MVKGDLESKSVAELRKLATNLGITGRSAMRKADLVDAIRKATDEGPTEKVVPAKGSRKAPGASGKVEAKAPKTAKTPRKKAPPKTRSAPRETAPRPARAAPVEAAMPAEPAAVAPAPEPVHPPAVVERAEVSPPPLSHAPPPTRPPAAREPSVSDVFIDRGPPLPEAYPGARVRVLVRDPGTIFVYWEIPEGVAGVAAWEIRAIDHAGEVRGSFRVDAWGRSGHGYLFTPAAAVRAVTLRPIRPGQPDEVVAAVAVPGVVQSPAPGFAPWVEVVPGAFARDAVPLEAGGPDAAPWTRPVVAVIEEGPRVQDVEAPVVGRAFANAPRPAGDLPSSPISAFRG